MDNRLPILSKRGDGVKSKPIIKLSDLNGELEEDGDDVFKLNTLKRTDPSANKRRANLFTPRFSLSTPRLAHMGSNNSYEYDNKNANIKYEMHVDQQNQILLSDEEDDIIGNSGGGDEVVLNRIVPVSIPKRRDFGGSRYVKEEEEVEGKKMEKDKIVNQGIVDVAKVGYVNLACTDWEDDIVWSDGEDDEDENEEIKNKIAFRPQLPLKSEVILPSYFGTNENISKKRKESKINSKNTFDKIHSKSFGNLNDDLTNNTWTDFILWDDDVERYGNKSKEVTLILDENDRNIYFDSAVAVDSEKEDEGDSGKENDEDEEEATQTQINKSKYKKIVVKRKPAVPPLRNNTAATNLDDRITKVEPKKHELKSFHKPLLSPFLEPEDYFEVSKSTMKKKTNAFNFSGLDDESKQLREFKDLSCKNGDIVLIELIEEHPAIVLNVGMSSLLVNWYRPPRRPNKFEDSYKAKLDAYNKAIKNPPRFPYGKLVELQSNETSPFLGDISEREVVSAVHSNLAKAPIWSHHQSIESTDFLLLADINTFSIKKGEKKIHKAYIREISNIFTSGQQEYTTYEVFKPSDIKEKNTPAQIFAHNFIGLSIEKIENLSSQIDTNSVGAKFIDIKRNFELQPDSVLRNILIEKKWVPKGGKLGESFIRSQDVTQNKEWHLAQLGSDCAEQLCLYESMLEAQYRLNSIGIHRLGSPSPELLQAVENLHTRAELLQEKYKDQVRLLKESPHLVTIYGECINQALEKAKKIFYVARFISAYLHTCPWYTTSNYIVAHEGPKDKVIMDLSSGSNDPFGAASSVGYSYVPKVFVVKKDEADQSSAELSKKMNQGKIDNKDGAHLRKLNNSQQFDLIKQIEDALGIKNLFKDSIGFHRWKRVDIITKHAQDMNSRGYIEFEKFIRANKERREDRMAAYNTMCQYRFIGQLNLIKDDRTDFDDYYDDFDDEEEDEFDTAQFAELAQNLKNLAKVSRKTTRGLGPINVINAEISKKNKEAEDLDLFLNELKEAKGNVPKDSKPKQSKEEAKAVVSYNSLNNLAALPASKSVKFGDDASSIASGNKSVVTLNAGSKSIGTASVIKDANGGSVTLGGGVSVGGGDDNVSVGSENNSSISKQPKKGPHGRPIIVYRIEITINLKDTAKREDPSTQINTVVTYKRNPEYVRKYIHNRKVQKKEARKNRTVLAPLTNNEAQKKHKEAEIKRLKAVIGSASNVIASGGTGAVPKGHCKDCGAHGHNSKLSKNCMMNTITQHTLSKPLSERVATVGETKLVIKSSGISRENSLSKKRNSISGGFDDYSANKMMKVDRKNKAYVHSNPHVAMQRLIHDLLTKVQNDPQSINYRIEPLDKGFMASYLSVVRKPVFLSKMFLKNDRYSYKTRKDVLEDFQTMVNNSIIFNEGNGTKPPSIVTYQARQMLDVANSFMKDNEEAFIKCENGGVGKKEEEDDGVSVISGGKSIVSGVGDLKKDQSKSMDSSINIPAPEVDRLRGTSFAVNDDVLLNPAMDVEDRGNNGQETGENGGQIGGQEEEEEEEIIEEEDGEVRVVEEGGVGY